MAGAQREEQQSDEAREELERFRAIVEYARDVITEISADGRLLWVSPSFGETFGWLPGEVLGKPVFELIHPDDRADVEQVREGAMASERPAQLTFRFAHRDGSWRWIELAGRPYRTASGEQRAVLIARDVTARVEAERAMEEQRRVELRIEALSRRFLALRSEALDVGFRQALEHAGEIGDADHVHFLVVATSSPEVQGEIQALYAWSAPGIPGRDRPEDWGRRLRRFGWSARRLGSGQVVHVPHVDALPEEARNERQVMREEGLEAVLALPVELGERATGLLNLARERGPKSWSEQEISRLHLLAEVLASAYRRRLADASRRAVEERLRLLTEHARDCICEITVDGEVTWASPRIAELLGYPEHELVQRAPVTLLHPDDLASARQLVEVGDPAHPISFRVRHRDGRWLWLEATSRRFVAGGEERVALVLRDATEALEHRFELERRLALEQAVARFSRELVSRGVGDFESSVRRGLEAAASIAGADRSYFVCSYGGEARTFDWRGPGVTPRHHPFGPHGTEERAIALGLLKEGRPLQVSGSVEPPPELARVRDSLQEDVRALLVVPAHAEGRLLGVLGFHCVREERRWSDHEIALLRIIAELFTSVLRRHEAELELADSQERLLQSQKMEAVGTLAGGIAHDFNNQLTVMLGNARHVLRHTEDADRVDALGDLIRAAEHCAQLTRSLLAFARRSPASPRVVEIQSVVADSAELLRPLIPRTVEFVLSRPQGSDPVRADPVQLQQILVNLAVNARDAMPDGGRLRVGTRRVDVDAAGATRLGLAAAGTYVEIAVEDTGVGMDAELQRRIFEPFFTTKAPGGGTGLGLATVYGVVRECGGAVEVDSAAGRGSTFRVLLPRASDTSGGPDGAPAERATPGSGTLLVVEDEEAVRRMARRVFEAAGYRVLEAHDGFEALRLLEERADEIRLVATDIEMPNLGGIELARRLAARDDPPPVLFLSASHADPRESLPASLQSRFVEKPFAEEALLAGAQALIDGSLRAR